MMATFPLQHRAAQLDAHIARQHARIERETAATPTMLVTGATAGGDGRKLRGIPAIGRGVRGAIANTTPGDNVR